MSKDLSNPPFLGCLMRERASRAPVLQANAIIFIRVDRVKVEYENALSSLNDYNLVIVALQAGVLVV